MTLEDLPSHYDLIVIGGGITGAGIALEAASAGLNILLVEQKDYAWGTSSRSSKMVHGGLRYLASGHFRLTRDAVRERQRMLDELPGLVDFSTLPVARDIREPGRKAFTWTRSGRDTVPNSGPESRLVSAARRTAASISATSR